MDTNPLNETPTIPQEKHGWWRYLLTLFLLVGVITFVQILVIGFAAIIEGNVDILSYPPVTLLWVSMLPFGAGLLVLLLCVRFLHNVPLKKFFTLKRTFEWKYLFFSAIIWFVLAVLSDVILAILQPGNYQITFQWEAFLPFMLSALILVPIQITAEEAIFRGYLQVGFRRLTHVWWLGVVLQALLFGLLHGLNTEVSVYGVWTTMPFYIGIGLLLGLATHLSRGLELAIGLHLANNLYSALVVTFHGSSIESPALFTMQEYQPVVGLVVFFVMAIIYFVWIMTLRQRFAARAVTEP